LNNYTVRNNSLYLGGGWGGILFSSGEGEKYRGGIPPLGLPLGSLGVWGWGWGDWGGGGLDIFGNQGGFYDTLNQVLGYCKRV